jgi:hypothetical protein
MMLNNDIYSLDNEFDYSTVKDIVLKARKDSKTRSSIKEQIQYKQLSSI